MNETSTLLELRDLTLRRGNFLLDRVSLTIGKSEIFAILGKTGSGKTLMLEAIAGFIKPDAGGVWLGGENVWDIPVTERSVGYLYQDYCLRELDGYVVAIIITYADGYEGYLQNVLEAFSTY